MSARLWHIGRDLQSRVKEFFEHPPGPDAAPLELFHASLDEVERRIQPAGRGRRVFPYDRVAVRIVQQGVDAVAVDAIFAQFEPRLAERLDELRCERPEAIAVSVSVAEPTADEPQPVLSVECSGEPAVRSPETPIAGYPRLTMTVVKGQCAESEYVFEEPVIAMGRTAEPTDAFGQVRYNHVAFAETRDGINETVGRAHARLQFDRTTGHYHLFNEGSSNPTSILRCGKTIRVAPRDPRGVRVLSGDQLQLGRAVLRVTVS